MYELKKLERCLRVNLLGPGSRLIKKGFFRAAVSLRFRNTDLDIPVTVMLGRVNQASLDGFRTKSYCVQDLGRPYWILHPVSCHTPEAATTVSKCP